MVTEAEVGATPLDAYLARLDAAARRALADHATVGAWQTFARIAREGCTELAIDAWVIDDHGVTEVEGVPVKPPGWRKLAVAVRDSLTGEG